MAEIYGIIHKDKIVYVGQTIIGYQKRFKKHIIASKKDNNDCALYNAFRKHGSENFSITLITECDKDLLNEREIEYIELYDTYKNGYNENIGGGTQSGYKHKTSTKKLLQNSMQDRWDNDRENILLSLQKRPPRIQSLQEKEKRREYLIEKNPMHEESTRQKLSNTVKEKLARGMKPSNRQIWKIKKENECIEINNMMSFCKEKGWNYQSMHTAKHRGLPYKGWIIEKVTN